MKKLLTLLLRSLIGVVLVPLVGCGKNPPSVAADASPSTGAVSGSVPARVEPAQTTHAATAEIPIYTYEVRASYPHDPAAFTQGLVFFDGSLWESTGLNGESSLRKVELKTGAVLQRVEVPARYFAEGLAVLGSELFQLTWQDHKAFVYDRATFKLEKEFAVESEGWGLTTDGHWLILSDGTDQIRFLDPATFEVKRTILVSARGRPVDRLNELEYIKGEIFANVWGADYVVRIDPTTGRVTGAIDFTGLLAAQDHTARTDVLNGIAYDAATDRLFITGKRWPKVFEVRLKLRQ